MYGERLVSVTYSRLDGKHLLESWIPLLALIAHDPRRRLVSGVYRPTERGTTPRVEGLGRPTSPPSRCCASWCRFMTRAAVSRFRCLSRRPTPGQRPGIPGDDPIRAAGYRWRSDRYPGEDQSPAHERAWGRNARLDDLMQPLRPGEEYEGEDHRFGAYAARLWLPMLRAERTPT